MVVVRSFCTFTALDSSGMDALRLSRPWQLYLQTLFYRNNSYGVNLGHEEYHTPFGRLPWPTIASTNATLIPACQNDTVTTSPAG